jgi:hypothetical protein
MTLCAVFQPGVPTNAACLLVDRCRREQGALQTFRGWRKNQVTAVRPAVSLRDDFCKHQCALQGVAILIKFRTDFP